MNWEKFLSDMSIATEKSVDPSFIYLGMLIDMYRMTKNEELKAGIEQLLIDHLPKKS